MVRTTADLSTHQQCYLPAAASSRLISTSSLFEYGSGGTIPIIPSHDECADIAGGGCCAGPSNGVVVEEWWARIRPSAIHDPPFAAFYPLPTPDRRWDRYDPCDRIEDTYPRHWLRAEAAALYYPSPEQYRRTIHAFNAAVSEAYKAQDHVSPHPIVQIAATLSVVCLPYLIWRASTQLANVVQAMDQDIVRMLWRANEVLDREWRMRGTQVGEGSDRRWQWRWIGLRCDQQNFKERPRLALVHIAPTQSASTFM